MAFERIFDASNATPFKFEGVGSTLEGYFMGSFDHTGDYGPTKKHIFQTKTGATVVFGQRNLLQQLPTVTPGVIVRITYTGDLAGKIKGRAPMKLFTIEHDKSNTIAVAGVDFNQTDEQEPEANFEAVEEAPLDEEEPVEAAPPRAAAPRQPARPPSSANQASVQELLNRNRAKTA